MNAAIEIKTDNEGYLHNHNDWSLRFLSTAATSDDVELTDDMINAVYSMREYYDDFGVVPPISAFSRKLTVKLNKKVNSDYIHELFPKGIKQAAKFAGLPKPTGCL